MIDFGPLLQNPFMLLFGAAAQFGIFFVVVVAVLAGFDIREAASIGIIGAADGPTSIFVANQLAPHLLGAITVAAYSYMALVPIIQPVAIKLVWLLFLESHQYILLIPALKFLFHLQFHPIFQVSCLLLIFLERLLFYKNYDYH